MRPILQFIILLFVSSCQSDKVANIQFPEGGYPYANHIPPDEQDLYFHPVKDVIPRKDSLLSAFYHPQLFEGFDEPNLSLTPPKHPVFRLTFESSFLGYYAMLTLTPDSIIVKEIIRDTITSNYGEEKLDSLEQKHLGLLDEYYPIDEYKINYSYDPYKIRYLDSLTTIYPQLLDPRYYHSLLTKANDYAFKTFVYKKWNISISQRTYKKLVDSINQSGYWKMKYEEFLCPGDATHSDVFMLEAATPDKYQVVNYMECTKPSNFQSAMEDLMKEGKLDESFKKWQENVIKMIKAKRTDSEK